MSLEEEQKEASRYALNNCVFEGGSLMGGDLGDTYSCEMGINGDIGTDAVHEDGYHRIEVDITETDGSAGTEEVFVKPILSTKQFFAKTAYDKRVSTCVFLFPVLIFVNMSLIIA